MYPAPLINVHTYICTYALCLCRDACMMLSLRNKIVYCLYRYVRTYVCMYLQYRVHYIQYTRILKIPIKNFMGFRNVRKSIETSSDISVL